MKNKILLLLTAVFVFTQCSPKVKDAVRKPVEENIVDESFRKTAPEPGPAPVIELGSYQEFILDNGLRVFVVENHKIPRVSWRLFVDVPPLMEGESAGYSQLAGDLLTTGTENKTKAEIDEAVDFIGANLSSGGSGIFAGSLTKHKETLLELMSEVLLHPSFPQDEFEKLKKQYLAGLAQAKDDPDEMAGNVSQVLRFGKDHPYGEQQTEETTENITLDECKAYYETYFKPNISYLIVVGDITPAEAKQSAEKYFGSWKEGMVEKTAFPMPQKPDEPKVAFVNKTGAVQSVLRVCYPIELKPGSPDVIKAKVMNTLLGGIPNARLENNIREDKGFTYGIRSSISEDPYVGSFTTLLGSVRSEVTDSAMTEILYEMKRLREERVPEDELSLIKSVMTGAFARGLESPQTIADYALNIARYNLPPDYYRTYLEKLNAVTAEDVMAMAKKYLTPDQAHILVVGNKAEVAEKLLPFDADGEIDYYDNYGNKLEVSGVSLPEGTTAQSVIDQYLEAIGGVEKLKSVKDVATEMTASIQGQTINASVKQKTSGKYLMAMSVNGMVLQEQKYDGEQAEQSAMGQSQKLESPEELASLKRQSMPFPELFYEEWGYTLNLQGVDQVEGKNVVAVEVVTPEGEKFTDFFDLETSLKVRTTATQEGPTGPAAIVTDIKDYREVDGIKMPFENHISGVMPIPLVMKVQSVKFNSGLEDSVFEIE
jgi:predicted Zn-dependent peptidase